MRILRRFPSTLEAEAARNFLVAEGIGAHVDNLQMGSIFPHQTQAFGGITLSVPEAEFERAEELLGESEAWAAQPEVAAEDEADARERRHHQLMKRAAYGALAGTFFLPVIANLFSVFLLAQAHRENSIWFWRRKTALTISVVFNLAGFALGGLLVAMAARIAYH